MGKYEELAKMRKALESAYPGTGWIEKVKRMHENQVVAVYLSFKKRGLVS